MSETKSIKKQELQSLLSAIKQWKNKFIKKTEKIIQNTLIDKREPIFCLF